VLTGGRVTELAGTGSLGELWSLPLGELRDRLGNAAGPESDPAEISVLAPVDGRTEVWACGVTYEISRAARREESERSADAYAQVYDAERPELFFKSAAWRVSGSGQPIAIRDDSAVNVPEPEVALVVTSAGQIAGYTVCNDVSSRSIEGENPLYLPQAKSYLGACAVGPMIRPAWEVADPYALEIGLAIDRDGAEIWRGTASTAQLRRRYDDLVRYLMHADVHPEGAVLSTGTCLVPATPFSLAEGDTVRITVDSVGTLENPVLRGLAAMKAAVDG
jgi:2-dehydro-3-deoxy-D-arabinonate dehydratase